MGAWPERDAPAGRMASAILSVEKGEGFVLPLFSFTRAAELRLRCFVRHFLKDLGDDLQAFIEFLGGNI